MRKLFTLAAALLASFSLWAESVTVDLALAKNSTPAPSIGTIIGDNYSAGSFDGSGYKIGSDGNSIGWNISDADETFTAISFTGYINTTSTEKYYGIVFSTDGGTTWGTEQQLMNDGTKSYHAVDCSGLTVPDGANAVKIIRRAGTSTYVSNITLTLAEAAPTTPVTSVTIEGPTEAAVGFAAKYTATTDVAATEYKWFVDDVEQTGATKKTFEFTPAVKGATYAIVCKARNDNNATDEWIASNTINVTGTKLCGELIKAVYDPNTKTSTVTGVIGGTADRNTQDNGKLGSNGHYYGAVLASGSLMAGDVVTVKASALNGGNTATLFADKGETELGSAAFDETTLTAVITLTKSASAVYLYRKDSGCNPNIESISVTRSCEDSNDATIHSLTVNGNEVAEEDGTFNYTLSVSYTDPTVEVAFEIHPLATADMTNPFTINVPNAGDTNGQSITVTAEDGTTKTYTVFITKSASLSDDWYLKELSVEGYTLTPAFDPETLEYHITRAYEAANPAASAVTAVPNDANATVTSIQVYPGNITIHVAAEDGSNNSYVIWIDVAPAVKKINEVILSNGYSAYIVEGQTVEPFVINGFYLAGQDAPTVSSYQVNDGTTWAIDGNNITLTGADNSIALYSLVLAEVAPADFSADEITFDGTETWVKAANGFGTDKGGWKFSKTDSDFSREIAGKTHVEFFLPACDTVVLKTGASGTERDVRFYVNGTQLGDKAKLTKAGVALAVEQSAPFMLTVASAQTSGDGGVGALRMAKAPLDPTAIDNTNNEVKAVKIIRDGQLFIQKNGVLYNAQGAVVK